VSDNLKFDQSSNTLTVNHVEGVDFMIGGKVIEGEVKLTKNTYVTARPQPGKVFPRGTQTRWKFEVNKDLIEQERAEAVEESLSAKRSAARQVTTAAEPVETRVQPSGSAPSGAGGSADVSSTTGSPTTNP
jgi:hypothetical protein